MRPPLGSRLKNAYWRLRFGRTARASHFAADFRDEFRSQYKGRAAEIFFSNEAEPIHKWLHYLPIYDELFQPFVGKKPRFLEIGVFRGGSLRMWRQFFGADAVLYGIDIDPKCAAYDGRHGVVRIGSQNDADFLKRVVNEMGGVDVVLDDGSHIASDQRVSFDALFPLLSEGGLYVVEDMHTAYWPQWEGGLRRPGTAVEFLKQKVDEMHRHYVKRGRNTPDAMPEIASVQFFDSIAAIRKQKQRPRHHVVAPPL
jgi:predicted O-methyltransferase YrrM